MTGKVAWEAQALLVNIAGTIGTHAEMMHMYPTQAAGVVSQEVGLQDGITFAAVISDMQRGTSEAG